MQGGEDREGEQKDTFQLQPVLRRGSGVADGRLGTKRRIDVDNLARASFERQIPCRKISDFPHKRGVPSTEEVRERGKAGKERKKDRGRETDEQRQSEKVISSQTQSEKVRGN